MNDRMQYSNVWMLDITIKKSDEMMMMSGGPRFLQWQQAFDTREDAEAYMKHEKEQCETTGNVCSFSGPYLYDPFDWGELW